MIRVNPAPKRLTAYTNLINRQLITDIEGYAKRLRGMRVVEINSTTEGGGVAEMLKSYIPLMADVGMSVSWQVIMPDAQFFKITKTIHNCLQGICPLPPGDELDYYNTYLQTQARRIPEADLYVLHDPQTLGLIKHLPKDVPVIWRCHIDLTSSDTKTLEWVRSFYKSCAKVIFSLDNYALGIDKQKIAIIEPAIDPLSEKNREMSDDEINQLLHEFDIDPGQKFITQISRFDKFKDPIGVLDMYSRLKAVLPQVGCVLMGSYATDDPEGYPYFQKLRAKINELKLPDIRLITKEDNLMVNAMQRRAAVVIQNSSREGFGLTVTEALWKGSLVFARPSGGIALQVINNRTGFYLLGDAEDDTRRMQAAVDHPEQFADISAAATAHVRARYLLPRMVADHMQLYSKVLGKE